MDKVLCEDVINVISYSLEPTDHFNLVLTCKLVNFACRQTTELKKKIVNYPTINRAAKNGHLPVVIWLHANRTEGCTTYAMNYAAENGHLEVVEWLRENRTEGCTTVGNC